MFSINLDSMFCLAVLQHLFLQVFNKEEGNISPRMAEMRADMGKAATDLTTMQTFDGPGPETINGECIWKDGLPVGTFAPLAPSMHRCGSCGSAPAAAMKKKDSLKKMYSE
jgi:hypothetical protein